VRAAVMYETGPEAVVDLRDDVVTVGPGPGEVKVRLRATGVCHSDLSVLAGVIPAGLPSVLGHEPGDRGRRAGHLGGTGPARRDLLDARLR
jgi:S-(hydroxymethyl)glutathione dehydrogenase/alcohol dehydrogenase